MQYAINKAASITHNNEPTMTDQAGARDTDINVIVEQFKVHGQVPGTVNTPTYEDFSVLPEDFRGYIEMARSMERFRDELPDQLKGLTNDQLLALTQGDLERILTPEQTPTQTPKETT